MATVTAAAADHYESVQLSQAVALAASRRAWDQIDERHVLASWTEQLTLLTPIMRDQMTAAARSASEYGVTDLAQRGTYVEPDAFVRPSAFGATAPSGAPLEEVLLAPATRSLQWVSAGVSTAEALQRGRSLLDGMARTFVSDTARSAASVDIASRPGVGYVRMLNPPSCDSCTILAGRFYRWNAGFLRHPRCDCIHRPSQSLDAAKSEGLIDDPYDYFESLSESEQGAIFGKAKAQAIRDGSDIYRVQNSWRGRDGLFTAEGTGRQRGTFRSFAQDLRGRRLTPEGIYRQARTREEALALLREHGYLLPSGQVSGGSLVGADYVGFGQTGRGGTRVSDGLTAAQRRLETSRLQYEAALAGRNPYGRGPATPTLKAQAETNYRRWLATNGEIYTS